MKSVFPSNPIENTFLNHQKMEGDCHKGQKYRLFMAAIHIRCIAIWATHLLKHFVTILSKASTHTRVALRDKLKLNKGKELPTKGKYIIMVVEKTLSI